MNVSEFLFSLYQQGINIQIDGESLKIGAPSGVLSPEIQAQLRERKAEIIAFLHNELTANISRPPLQRVDRSKPIPVSFPQLSLWLQYQLEEASNTYNIPIVYHIRGELDIVALEKSFRYLIARHDALRTSFNVIDGEPCQLIAGSVEWELDVRKSGAERDEQELLWLAAEPFSLEQAPLMRAHLWKHSQDDYTLLFNIHHIIFDTWSQEIFEKELSYVYSQFAAGQVPDPSRQDWDYADYAAWQRNWLQGQELQHQMAFWQENLRGAPELLELPTDHPRPPLRTYRGSKVYLNLDAHLENGINDLVIKEGGTLFMFFTTAYAILLGRYSRQEQVTIGVPVTNRSRQELESVFGYFINTLPLYVDLSGNPTLSELFKRFRKNFLDALAHQDVPFDKLIDELHIRRDASYSPVFQVLFVIENKPSQYLRLGKANISSNHIDIGAAKFDLTLFVRSRTEGLTLELEYNTDLFERSTARRILVHYRRLLDWMVSAPSNRIRDFELLSPIEKKRVLTDWTGTAVKFDRELCIHQLIERQAGNNPDAPAVAFEHRVMTYRELDQYANQLAHYLRAQGIGPGMLVGIFMERTPDMIVALLGVLKAGAAYLPLDLTYPEERLKFICQDAHPKLILSQQYIHVSPPEIENVPLFNLDTDWDALASFYTTHKPINLSNPNHLAYVLFTSGTTGRPKGVALPHRSALGLVEWIRRTFSAQELSGVLASTSIGFDMSVFEILGTLALGGCMILVDNILDILAYHGTYPITLINTVPSAVAELLNTTRIPSSVSTIVLAGEPLSTQLVDNLYQVPGIQRIYDAYGPTETSYSTQCLRKAGNRPTIGKPLPGWKVYILDDDLHLLPVGIPGEIYIGGIGIADGYYGHPELTCERFLINPYGDDPLERFYRTGDLARWLADGNIEYIGRMDHQVKIRGFRVELAEVENTLSLHPSVGQAVVVTREDHPGDKRLVAYIIPIIKKKDLSSAKTNLESEKLRGFLREKLPNYMIPSAFVQMDAFPLTASGKIDRKALPPPGLDIIDTQSYIPPINQTEHGLSNIWMDVLKLPRISREDNFFDLGGNSLSALQVMARILETFEINMPIKWIFEFPRLSDLANRVDFVLHYKKQSLYSEEGMNNREDFAL